MLKREHFDDAVSDTNVRCSLGVNKKTGRLQWCPGYCTSHRMLFTIPAIVIPVILLFVLFIHLETSSGESVDIRQQTVGEDSLQLINQSREPLPPCRPVKVKLSETVDTEDREILKDTRTSFVPTGTVLVPPHCRDDLDELNLSKEDVNILKLTEILSRKRRSEFNRIHFNHTHSTTPLSTRDEDYSNEDSPWKLKLDDCDTQFEDSDNPSNWDCDESFTESFHSFWKGEGSPEKIRSTQAHVMQQYMDTTANPCNDFYQYACGNWDKFNPIPQDRAAYDTFEMLRESLDYVLKDLLKTKKENSNPISTTPSTKQILHRLSDGEMAEELEKMIKIREKRRYLTRILNSLANRNRRDVNSNVNAEVKAKYLYDSCMNYRVIERRGISPLLRLLEELGGWPVLDPTWNEENFDWLNLTANLRLYNNDIFLAQWVGPDIKNSEENIIQFDQTSLGLPTRDYFIQPVNQPYLDAYEIYMTTIIEILGADPDNARNVAREVINFEVELAKITSSSEERTNVSLLYKRMTLATLHQIIPQIDWTRYLTIVLERPVNSNETIVLFATKFMQELVKLIDRSKKETISNYLLWRFVRHRVNNLDDRFQDAKQKFYKVLFGREKSPARWKVCVSQVNSNMGMAVGAMFVRKYFDENSKNDTLTMTHELQDAFREILNETAWIEDSTKVLAELKVNEMSLKIGFPDYILAHEELNQRYDELEIDPKKYFENTLNVLMHLTRMEQRKLGQVVNKTLWHTAPAVVNAYYSRNKNQIMFPAGILQPPFYHRHFPKSLNFGGIGVVIGHELTHGFDDKGRLFDHDGNLHRWWSDNDIDGFHERARCLISQYGKYVVSEVGISVDGENTQGENIADNGGIKQAFRAYEKWLAEHPESVQFETLPQINATHTELFFINFAQVWCGAMRPEATRNKLKTAVHSPGRFRVIGTLSNSEDFSKVYKCPRGSPMNPTIKCGVW